MPKVKKKEIKDPQPVPVLNQDVINLIAKYVSYTEGLAAFRQTSRYNNYCVEHSDAGQLARKASDFEPSRISTSIASFCKNKEQKIKLENWCLPIIFLVSVLGKSDFSKGINILNVGISVAASVGRLLGGILIVGLTFKKTTKYLIDDLINAIIFTFTFGFLNAGSSIVAGSTASIVCTVLKAIFGFPGSVPMSDVCLAPEHKKLGIRDGEHLARFIGVNTVIKGISDTAANVSSNTSVAAAIARLGILANNHRVKNAHTKQTEIRTPLYKPNYIPVNQQKISTPEIEGYSNFHCTL